MPTKNASTSLHDPTQTWYGEAALEYLFDGNYPTDDLEWADFFQVALTLFDAKHDPQSEHYQQALEMGVRKHDMYNPVPIIGPEAQARLHELTDQGVAAKEIHQRICAEFNINPPRALVRQRMYLYRKRQAKAAAHAG